MGIIFKILKQGGDDDEAVGFIDFENDRPTTCEMGLFGEVNPLIKRMPEILEEMSAYPGASELIRKCIANPKDTTLYEETWKTLLPLIDKSKMLYLYSVDITNILPTILKGLCENGFTYATVETKPAHSRMFSQIVDFALKFDELKMGNPNIQNDLSYYRRILSNGRPDDDLSVTRDFANKLSIFLANTSPFIHLLCQTVEKNFTHNTTPSLSDVTTCFSLIIKLCKYMLDNPSVVSRFADSQTVKFCLKVMIGLLIIYDHVHPLGCFCKSSEIDIRGCVKVIRDHTDGDPMLLLNLLKYASKTFNYDTTPSSVKALFQGSSS